MTEAPEKKQEDSFPDFPEAGTRDFTWHYSKGMEWAAVCGLVDFFSRDRLTSNLRKVTCTKCLKIIEDAKEAA